MNTSIILQLNTQTDPATSVGGIVHAIAQSVDSVEGMKSVVVAGYGKLSHSDAVLESRMRYRAYALRSRFFGDDGFLTGEPTQRLLSVLNRAKPALVHIHNAHGYYLDTPAFTRYLLRNNIPVMLSMHDLWWLTGRCAVPVMCTTHPDGNRGCENCQCRQNYPAIRTQQPPRYKASLLAPLNAHIVVPTEYMGNIVEKSVLAHLPVTVIENGIDTGVYHSNGKDYPGTRDGNLRLIAVSMQWNRMKNEHDLKVLADNMPSGWTLTVVGKGFDHKGHNIHHITHCTKEQLAELYRHNDVLLSPSLSESFGLTIAEANACGIPAVANSRAYPRAYIPRGNGTFADFSNVSETIAAIRTVAGTRPQTAVRSIKDMADAYTALYRRILGF